MAPAGEGSIYLVFIDWRLMICGNLTLRIVDVIGLLTYSRQVRQSLPCWRSDLIGREERTSEWRVLASNTLSVYFRGSVKRAQLLHVA